MVGLLFKTLCLAARLSKEHLAGHTGWGAVDAKPIDGEGFTEIRSAALAAMLSDRIVLLSGGIAERAAREEEQERRRIYHRGHREHGECPGERNCWRWIRLCCVSLR
jgi:hypothetical protein